MSGGSHSLHGRRDLRYLRQRRLPAGLTAAAAALVVAAGCSSGTGSSPAGPPARPAASAAIASCRRQYGSDCYTPQQLQIAYDIQPLLARGIDGQGQTVAVMEFASTPPPASQPAGQVTDIRQDLALFDAEFGLPAARLQAATSLAGSAYPWLANGEEVEDAEIVHAVTPDAAIRVVLIPPWSDPASWMAAVDGVLRLARSRASVVSLSAILGEECFTPAEAAAMNSALHADAGEHVTVVAGSGDFGAASSQCADFGLPTSVRQAGLSGVRPARARGRRHHHPGRRSGHRRLPRRDRVAHPARLRLRVARQMPGQPCRYSTQAREPGRPLTDRVRQAATGDPRMVHGLLESRCAGSSPQRGTHSRGKRADQRISAGRSPGTVAGQATRRGRQER